MCLSFAVFVIRNYVWSHKSTIMVTTMSLDNLFALIIALSLQCNYIVYWLNDSIDTLSILCLLSVGALGRMFTMRTERIF